MTGVKQTTKKTASGASADKKKPGKAEQKSDVKMTGVARITVRLSRDDELTITDLYLTKLTPLVQQNKNDSTPFSCKRLVNPFPPCLELQCGRDPRVVHFFLVLTLVLSLFFLVSLRLQVVGAHDKMFYARMQVLNPNLAEADIVPNPGAALKFASSSSAVALPHPVMQEMQGSGKWTFETWVKLAAAQLQSGQTVPVLTQDVSEHIRALEGVKGQLVQEIKSVASSQADVLKTRNELQARLACPALNLQKKEHESACLLAKFAKQDGMDEAGWAKQKAAAEAADAEDDCALPLEGFLTAASCKPFAAYKAYDTARKEFPKTLKAWQADKATFDKHSKTYDAALADWKRHKAAFDAVNEDYRDESKSNSCPFGPNNMCQFTEEQSSWSKCSDKGGVCGKMSGGLRYVRYGRLSGSGPFLVDAKTAGKDLACQAATFGDLHGSKGGGIVDANFPAVPLNMCRIGRKCVETPKGRRCVTDGVPGEDAGSKGCTTELKGDTEKGAVGCQSAPVTWVMSNKGATSGSKSGSLVSSPLETKTSATCKAVIKVGSGLGKAAGIKVYVRKLDSDVHRGSQLAVAVNEDQIAVAFIDEEQHASDSMSRAVAFIAEEQHASDSMSSRALAKALEMAASTDERAGGRVLEKKWDVGRAGRIKKGTDGCGEGAQRRELEKMVERCHG